MHAEDRSRDREGPPVAAPPPGRRVAAVVASWSGGCRRCSVRSLGLAGLEGLKLGAILIYDRWRIGVEWPTAVLEHLSVVHEATLVTSYGPRTISIGSFPRRSDRRRK